MKADILGVRWSYDIQGGWVSFLTEGQMGVEIAALIEDSKDYELTVQKKRKKRSLNANAYAWVLIGKISAETGQPPVEVYRDALKDVGDNFEVLSLKDEAVYRWRTAWEDRGLGWICEVLGASDRDGYTDVVSYYGSSVYDTKQMSRLIDILVQDAKALGIETLTPDELQKMVSLWQK